MDQYDYAGGKVGSLLRKTITNYASLGNGIVDHPASVTVEDGSSNIKAQTSYTYDQGGVTTTSGTPQHIGISGSRGNVTTASALVQGSTTLQKTYTYYDTGTVNTSTDVNGAVTTYTYGSGSCGNSFVTQVSEPLSLSKSMTWNCTGGVVTSATDENGTSASATYSDPYFWRPASSTDQALNTTAFGYNPIWVVSLLEFNNNSSQAETGIGFDGLGRKIVTNHQQAPGLGVWDTFPQSYDTNGRLAKVYMPCATGAWTCNTPYTSFTYDALNRLVTTTDGGGGTVTDTPSGRDVLHVVSSPSSSKQYEYNGLGQLISVCEISSSLPGVGTCGQDTQQTGYWTRYQYDALGNLTGVCQNTTQPYSVDCVANPSAGQQTRKFTYDGLSRMTSEADPENGTVTYVYETDSTCGGSAGDRVRKTDAAGNIICYGYDALHRLTATGNGNVSGSTAEYFVYDAATVNGVSMSNVKGRLAEAYTVTVPNLTTKITDEGFSYSVRGEPTDVYESTPHSGGYYHVSASYWPHGALQTLTGVGLPTLYYGAVDGSGLDGEGRYTKVTASSGTSPIASGVTYTNSGTTQPIGSLTGITLGSGDTESFSYDVNTGRKTNYSIAINGTATYGNLTYNSNGTVSQLAITDPFKATDQQTCNYTYDDVVRIKSVDCGASIWQQNFSYPDAFGNLVKTVPTGGTGVSWQPTYNSANNRYSAIPGVTVAYDNNGNLLQDNLHSYVWDINNRAVTIDSSIHLIYDALGREVETQNGSTYTEFVYALGQKLAVMNGQTQTKAFVPLPGGAQVQYAGSAISTYQLADWLGSLRVGSKPNRTYSWGVAFAPLGERYASKGSPAFTFTGDNEDTASGLYDFTFRELSNSQGRWISPDPAGLAAADPSDPQTWNRYAYVRNNPLSRIDPLGLSDCTPFDYHAACGEGGYYGYGNPGNGSSPGDASAGGSGSGGGGLSAGGFGPGGAWGGPAPWVGETPTQLQEEVRWNSILATGWDPELGIQYYKYSFTGGDGSIFEQQKELAAIQLGQQRCAGQGPTAIASCIQQAYDTLVVAVDPKGNPLLVGGNYNFSYVGVTINGLNVDPTEFGCAFGRCGMFDSLHFNFSAGTFHVDTANPWFIPIGSFAHLGVDLIGGNWWWSGGIPR